MNRSPEVISNRESIIDQLELLIDELTAQRPWLNRIPEAQLFGKALESDLSLFQMYEEMERQERDHLAVFSLVSPSGAARTSSIDALLDRLIAERRTLTDHLKSSSLQFWQSHLMKEGKSTVEEVAFKISQTDAAVLRTIAERLYESQISFSK